MSDKQVAVITGAARGIGAATTLQLAASGGWHVIAIDACRDEPALGYHLATRDDLDHVVEAGAGAVLPVVADVRDPGALQLSVEMAMSEFGRLDAAIAAAGAMAGGESHWLSDHATDEVVLGVNLGGVMALARAAIPALLEQPAPREGRFLAVASAAATRGLPGLAAYCAAKAGVTGFVRALAVELRETGVTVNAVSPGSTRTAMLTESARLYDLSDVSEFSTHQTIGRLIEPEEVASMLTYLAGPGGSAMTGAIVAVDGGMSI